MNKLEQIRKKVNNIKGEKALLRINNSYYERVEDGILTYNIFYRNIETFEKIKEILEKEKLSYASGNVYGKTYNYSVEFEIPLDLTGKQLKIAKPVEEIPNDVLVSTFAFAIESADRYKYKLKPEYKKMRERINEIETEILSRMVHPKLKESKFTDKN